MANYATRIYSATATFTPAAAEHVAGDVNGGAQLFTFLDRNGQPPSPGAHLVMRWANMLIAGGTIETTAWALHLYNVTPPSALADDAAFDLGAGGTAAADRAAYLGAIAIAQIVDLGSTLYIEGVQTKLLKLSGTTAYGYLVNGTTLTPAAVAHNVTLFAEAL